MRCPFCHTPDSRVIDSRELSDGASIRRRRDCVGCGRRFTTYERVESAGLIVVKKDGRRQEFDPDKLRQQAAGGPDQAAGGRAGDRGAGRAGREPSCWPWARREVPSSAIGELVLQELKELDQVAYIRFASVYRQFADLSDMQRELETLRDDR